mmetsp:Transcript_45065/g.107084  ORF Transcript_45065/g.107084 Transcript_45065/m.107084 type:complete len:249 (+) Transcript_45065:49-795(+)
MARKPAKRSGKKSGGPVGKNKRQRKKAERHAERKAARAEGNAKKKPEQLEIAPAGDSRQRDNKAAVDAKENQGGAHIPAPRVGNADNGKKGKRKSRGEDTETNIKAPFCQRMHRMQVRTTNPTVYTKKACCDVCGLMNLPVKRKQFFHCSFCHFDLCPKCGADWDPKVAKEEERKAVKEALSKAKKKKKKDDEDASEEERDEEEMPSKEDREASKRLKVWIPSEAVAVNRAPLKPPAPVTAWVEGVPL